MVMSAQEINIIYTVDVIVMDLYAYIYIYEMIYMIYIYSIFMDFFIYI